MSHTTWDTLHRFLQCTAPLISSNLIFRRFLTTFEDMQQKLCRPHIEHGPHLAAITTPGSDQAQIGGRYLSRTRQFI